MPPFVVGLREVTVDADGPAPVHVQHFFPADDETPRPLIVFDGGLSSAAVTFQPTAEFLASHGFHAVTFPSCAPDAGGELTFDATGVRRKTANVERVLRAAVEWPCVDEEAIGLAGWSVGGVTTAVLATQTPAARALLSLDGGLGYDYGEPLYRELTDDHVSKTFLHVTGTAPNAFPVAKALEFDIVDHDDAFIARVDGINHSGFSFESAADDHSPAFQRAHSAVLELTRLFFDYALRGRAGDFARAAGAVDPTVAAVSGLRA